MSHSSFPFRWRMFASFGPVQKRSVAIYWCEDWPGLLPTGRTPNNDRLNGRTRVDISDPEHFVASNQRSNASAEPSNAYGPVPCVRRGAKRSDGAFGSSGSKLGARAELKGGRGGSSRGTAGERSNDTTMRSGRRWQRHVQLMLPSCGTFTGGTQHATPKSTLFDEEYDAVERFAAGRQAGYGPRIVLKSAARQALKSSFGVASLCYVVSDAYTRLAFAAGHIQSDGGTPHQGRSIDESVEYVHTVFADYKTYGGVDRFEGKIAEIGPGDNCGVGLLFLADGCTKADLVDRFYSKRNAVDQSRVYRALRSQHTALEQLLCDANLEDEQTFPGIQRWYGSEAAAENFFEGQTGYDFIVSRAVFEHLYDPLGALRSMAAALAPGGMLLHKVDLRDHGMFSEHFHELKFLEVPDWLYPQMTVASGRPNRVLVNRYRDCARDLGLDFELLVTRLVGVGDIEPHVSYAQIPKAARETSLRYVEQHRRRFAHSFSEASSEDLSISGVFLVARDRRKPFPPPGSE